MPNWCQNTVTVSHEDPAMMKRFADAFNRGELLNEFFPLPEELRETTSPVDTKNTDLIQKYGADNWYDWQVNNWGTKWDIGGEGGAEFELDSSGLSGNGWFDSAWSPPLAAYEKLLEMGFDIDATYFEPGMLFAGHWENGEDKYYENWDFENENWREGIDDSEVLYLLESEYESWLMWKEEEE